VTSTRQFTKGQKFFVIMAIFVCSLLFYANAVAFNLISAPIFVNDIIAYAALTVAVTLTVITLTIVIRDKRRSVFPKTQKSTVIDSIKESNAAPETPDTASSPTIAQESADKVESDVATIETAKVPDETPAPIAPPAKVFRKRNFFVIIVTFTVGLLFFANVVAFGLISLPEYVIYAAVAGAAALAAITLTVILSEKIKVLGNRIKSFVSGPQIQDIINEVKETDQAPDTASAPVIAQVSPKTVDSYAELLRRFGVRKAISEFEEDTVEPEEPLPQQPVIPSAKVICPACRKTFNLPDYERDYIVDFGRPKPSNPVKQCPHCQTSIPLKCSGAVEEEDIWKD
jgi:hypothetical protein